MKYVKPIALFHDLMKAKAPERRRLLGLDVGKIYIGLAVSDSNNKIASPLSVLVRKNNNIDLMAKDFQTLISELSLEGFVIGCCYDRRRYSPDAVHTKLFIEELHKTKKFEDLKYTYWDEHLTSKCAEALLKPFNLPPVLAKTMTDKFAAVGILQDYLDGMNRNSKLS
ncbi:hypothetical protein Scep_001098 [Stephania cephalantha]|uniref:YqgF/RNase H-like domain-containing protein n=1 Tax=Stephania cephalantha TaxID=152367 RepID=A0AAP0Q311_9MAGN